MLQTVSAFFMQWLRPEVVLAAIQQAQSARFEFGETPNVQENVRRLTQKPPPLHHAVQKLLDSLKAFRVMTSRYGINKV
jgi:hypothetical protein